MGSSYLDSVATFKRELARLDEELKGADAAGDRNRATRVLGQMLSLQKRFMLAWGPDSAALKWESSARQRQPGPQAPRTTESAARSERRGAEEAGVREDQTEYPAAPPEDAAKTE